MYISYHTLPVTYYLCGTLEGHLRGGGVVSVSTRKASSRDILAGFPCLSARGTRVARFRQSVCVARSTSTVCMSHCVHLGVCVPYCVHSTLCALGGVRDTLCALGGVRSTVYAIGTARRTEHTYTHVAGCSLALLAYSLIQFVSINGSLF